jgi:hypothetical protein
VIVVNCPDDCFIDAGVRVRWKALDFGPAIQCRLLAGRSVHQNAAIRTLRPTKRLAKKLVTFMEMLSPRTAGSNYLISVRRPRLQALGRIALLLDEIPGTAINPLPSVGQAQADNRS